MLNLDENGTITMNRIPVVDIDSVMTFDLETDIKTAINNNEEIISERAVSSGDTANGNKKERTLDDLEERLKIKMMQLFETIEQEKLSYEAARVGYNGARMSWNRARKQHSLGMLGASEYLQAEMEYIQKQTGYEAAGLSLFQALEQYKWAVKGLVELD